MGKVIIIAAFLTLAFSIVWLFVEGEMLKNEIKKLQLRLARVEGTQRIRELRTMQEETRRKTQ